MKDTKVLPRKELTRSTPLVARSPMKRSRKPSTAARKAAKGQGCCVGFPGCTGDTATTVLAHLRMFGGGGMGIKPPDDESTIACAHCHDILDGRNPWTPDPDDTWNWWRYIAWALIRTIRAQRKDKAA